jgi:hypothetical protein
MKIYVLMDKVESQCEDCDVEIAYITLDETMARSMLASNGCAWVEVWEVDKLESRKVAQWP